jgi:hypothetical protein
MAATMIGAKGSDVYSSSGNNMVSLSALLVRGVNQSTVKAVVSELVETLKAKEDVEDLMVLAFQTRDIRGGKGERDASRYIFEALLDAPQSDALTASLLELVPEYGCWQDLFKLSSTTPSIKVAVKDMVKSQFAKDEAAIAAYNASQANEAAGWGNRLEEAILDEAAERLGLKGWGARDQPVPTLLAWAMLIGACVDAVIALLESRGIV